MAAEHHSARQKRNGSGQFAPMPWESSRAAEVKRDFQRAFNTSSDVVPSSPAACFPQGNPVNIGWTTIVVSPFAGVRWDCDPTRPYN